VSESDPEWRLFREMFHQSRAVKLLVDPKDGRIRDANPAASDFYGLSHAELIRRRISDFNTLPMEKIHQEMDAARTEQRNCFRFEHRLDDGSVRDVEVFSSPITLKGETLLVSIIHDVTARNDYERELSVLRDVVENLPVGIYRTTMDHVGRFISVNSEMVRITEAESVDALLETPVQELYADQETRKAFIDALKAAPDWHSQAIRLRTLKGRLGHFRVTVRKRRGEDGQVFIDGILEDLSYIRAAEQSRQQLYEIIEATPVIIGISKADGRLEYLNAAGRELLGLRADESLSEFQPRQAHTKDSFKTLTSEALPTAIEKGQWTGEMCFCNAKGDEIPVQTTLIAHYTEDGEILRVSAVSMDVSSQKARQQALERLAYRDSLTGVLNRRGFMRALRDAVNDARQHHTPLSIIMADLDHFKPINDNHGHPVGDEILKKLPRYLQGRRDQDQVGRLGGEEFGILLPGADLEKAGEIAETIRASLAEAPIATSAGEIPITLSLGVSEFQKNTASGASLIRAADKALYAAKNAGRNRVRQG